MSTWLSRVFAAGVTSLSLLVIIAYVLTASAGRSQAIDPTVSIGSATAPPGSEVTVDVVVTPGTGVTIGALGIVVMYDNALLSPLACFASAGDANGCNTAFSTDQVAFAWVSASDGISGLVGTITFNTPPTEGVAFLAVTITTCADEVGNYLTCATVDGEITIVQPTASPTPSPTATPQPTPSPSPTPTRIWGDVNCNGAVTAVDALAILRKVAGLPVIQATPCPSIGAAYP